MNKRPRGRGERAPGPLTRGASPHQMISRIHVSGWVGGRGGRRPTKKSAYLTPPNFAPDSPARPAKMQVRMALTPNSLARRKPGVQIPSPPPHNSPGHRPGGSPPPGQCPSRGAAGAANGQQSPGSVRMLRCSLQVGTSEVCPRRSISQIEIRPWWTSGIRPNADRTTRTPGEDSA